MDSYEVRRLSKPPNGRLSQNSDARQQSEAEQTGRPARACRDLRPARHDVDGSRCRRKQVDNIGITLHYRLIVIAAPVPTACGETLHQDDAEANVTADHMVPASAAAAASVVNCASDNSALELPS
jgi:hypothetical protein